MTTLDHDRFHEAATPAAEASADPFRYRASANLAGLVESLGISLFVTTYQAGKLVVIRSAGGRLSTLLRSFEQAMGLAVSPQSLTLGTRSQVWEFVNAPDLARRMAPAGTCNGCFLPRRSHVTGDIRIHEMARAGGELWIVNTRFSCLVTLHADWSFVPRWRPPFISEIAAEDRCHLNGLAVDDHGARYVTAVGASNAPQGWRESRGSGGILIDVASGETVYEGLSMPHSPRLLGQGVLLLDSGSGRLVLIDPKRRTLDVIAELPGYARGLAVHQGLAFIGLSRMRERSTFGGLPIEERVRDPKCGVWVVELQSGRTVAQLEFDAGVEEIFDVQVLAGMSFPAVVGLQKEAVEQTFVIPDECGPAEMPARTSPRASSERKASPS